MVITIRIWVCTLTLLLAASAAQARDNDRGRWWLTPNIQQALNLTETEIQKLDETYDAAYYRMIEIRSAIQVERLKLRELMKDSRFDKVAIQAQYHKQQKTRAQLKDERFAFLLEAHDIIGHDRFLKLLDINDARRRRYRSKQPDDTKGQSINTPNQDTNKTQ